MIPRRISRATAGEMAEPDAVTLGVDLASPPKRTGHLPDSLGSRIGMRRVALAGPDGRQSS